MNTDALPAFLRSLKSHPEADPVGVFAVMQTAGDAYGHPHRHAGIGMRRIGDFMECRDALDRRLLFRQAGDTLEFHFYGTHKEVKTFLRNRR